MNYKTSNPRPNKLERYIKDNKSGEEVRNYDGVDYNLGIVTLPIDYPFYNLQNARTREDCRQLCVDKGLEKHTFTKKNYTSKSAQDFYHEIIYDHAQREKEAYEETFEHGFQRDPILLSHDGIIANGNTRMSYWREHQTFSEIKCLVFKEGIKFREILKLVNKDDSGKDITQKYLWYQRALQAKEWLEEDKNKNNGELNAAQYKQLAEDCQYDGKADLLKKIEVYDLAIEFLENDNFVPKTFKELRDTGAGSQYGKQSFETLQKLKSANENNLSPEQINHLKNISFHLIETNAKGHDMSAHSAIENIWSTPSLKKIKEKYPDSDSDPLLDDESEDERPPYQPPSSTEMDKVVDDAIRKNKIEKQKGEKKRLSRNIKKISEDIDVWIKDLLPANQDIKAATKSFESLETSVKNLKKELKKYKT